MLADQPILPLTDYVLVYEASDLSLQYPRKLFEQAMELEGLCLERQTIGDQVFLRIFVPFDRLAVEAERIEIEMPLKGCALKPTEPTCCISLSKLLVTDDEVDFISAPFDVDKQHLFVGDEDKQTFFRTSTRGLLVHHILINIDIHNELRLHPENDPDDEDGLRRRGLLYLLMRKAYTDAFVLHEPSVYDPYYQKIKQNSPEEFAAVVDSIKIDSRRDLNERWTKLWKFQPLWKVRDYFGEGIAFYFAWQGTFLTMLWFPAVIGIAIFIYGLSLSLKNHPESVNNCTSTTVTKGNLSTQISNCTLSKSLKMFAEDIVLVIEHSFDNEYSALFALLICLWGALFMEIWKRNRYTLAYEWDCDSYSYSEPDRPEFYGTKKLPDPVTGQLEWNYSQLERLRKAIVSFVVVAASVGVVFASVAAVLLYKVTMRVQFNCTAQETDTAAQGGKLFCLLMCTVIPTILNSLSIMILGVIYTKLAYKLTDWENHRTQSGHENALIFKLFAFQFSNTYASLFYTAFFRPEENGFQTNGLFNLGPSYKDTCARGTCMPLLSLQVLVLMLMKPFPKLYKDFIWPYISWYINKLFKYLGGVRRGKVGSVGKTMGKVSASSEGVCMAEETSYLWREWRKAPLGDFTLGEYSEKVVQYGYIMMFSSSFPLAPFLALAIGLLDIRLDAKRLLWFNRRPVAFVAADIGMWFPVMRFVTLCGVMSNAFIVAYTSDFCQWFFSGDDQCSVAHRLTIVVLFENFILIAMYIISGVVPDAPDSIKLAERRERFAVGKILEGEYVPGQQGVTIEHLSALPAIDGNLQDKPTVCSPDGSVGSQPIIEITQKWTRLHRQNRVELTSPLPNIPEVSSHIPTSKHKRKLRTKKKKIKPY